MPARALGAPSTVMTHKQAMPVTGTHQTTETHDATAPCDRRHFCAHETSRLRELDGLPLATFFQRLLGYLLDVMIAVVIWGPLEFAWRSFVWHQKDIELKWDFHEPGNALVVLLYFGLSNYFGHGQTPGKWVARTRAVSLTSSRMGFWQSIERALGYGGAVLEGGLGFLQYFWSANRMCAQDRLAETVVIDVRKGKS
jgi:uncharacterized RDD family membrane protein YckC